VARYRKIDVRLWVDEKFKSLSPLQPSGQALWIYLLTNPNTSNVPGLYRAGEAQLADELGWPIEAFREAFREAFDKGMVEADWRTRVIWTRNALKYQRPESPNVVRSWAVTLDEIPECELKHKAIQYFTKAFEQGFAKAFGEAFGEAYGESGAGAGAGAGGRSGSGVRQSLPPTPVAPSAAAASEPTFPTGKGSGPKDTGLPMSQISALVIDTVPVFGGDATLSFPVVGGKNGGWMYDTDTHRVLVEAYPDLDVMASVREARGWCEVNKSKRKTPGGMKRFLFAWCGRDQNNGRNLRTNGHAPSVKKKMSAAERDAETKAANARVREWEKKQTEEIARMVSGIGDDIIGGGT
jgi:hypothetical protein